MSSSLSIVLVIHNCESSLTANVLNLLDIAADLSSYVELLIIDDGSIDETQSVAQDLARRFPQVYVHHNAMRYGNTAAMQTAMRETIGEYVYFCSQMPSAAELRKLWGVRKNPRFIMEQPVDALTGSGLRLIHRPSVVSRSFSRADSAQNRGPEPLEARNETVGTAKHRSRTGAPANGGHVNDLTVD